MTTFVQAVEARSFSAAALRLGVAKSIVSRRIQALETRVGTRLLHRSTRQLSLTEPGEAFLARARSILADVQSAEDEARSLHGGLRGRLRIAAPLSFGLKVVSPVVAAFLREHPQIAVELDLDDRWVDLVREGVDVAVRIGKLPDSSLVARTLAPCRQVVCASPDYLARHGTPRAPADLADGHACLVYANRPPAEQWRFLVGRRWVSVPVRGAPLAVNNGDALVDAALAGVGLVVLPAFFVDDALADGRLVQVLERYRLDDPAIHAVWPSGRAPSAKVRAFVTALRAAIDGRGEAAA